MTAAIVQAIPAGARALCNAIVVVGFLVVCCWLHAVVFIVFDYYVLMMWCMPAAA